MEQDGAVAAGQRTLVSVVMPVYNEAETIEEVLEEILAYDNERVDLELLIVESNSTDGTRDLLSKYVGRQGVRLFLQAEPRGKGNAVREGLRHARGEIILIQDGDLEYKVSDYTALLQPILDGEQDFVLGNRHVRGKPIREVPDRWWLSRVMNGAHWFLATLFNLTYRTNLRDPFTMYKVFRTTCIQDVVFVADRFDFDWEIMAKLVRKGYRPIEVPVSYQARGFHKGKKIRPFRDPPTWIAACFRFRFAPIAPPPQPPVPATEVRAGT